MRRNLLWGVIPLAVALVLLLRAFAVIPDGLYDLLSRSWPALLVLTGVALILNGRTRLGNLIAVGMSLLLVAGMAFFAYSSRANQPRDDQQVTIEQALDAGTTLLAVNVNLLNSDLEFISTTDSTVTGTFTGSLESEVRVEFAERGDGVAELTISERKPDQFPVLTAVGRGSLRLELPAAVALAIAVAGEDGDATLNLNDLWLERLSIDLESGDALVTLPEYQPRSPSAVDESGQLTLNNGDLTVIVPPQVAIRMALNRGGSDVRPQFDDAYILIDDGADGTLEKRDVGDDDILLNYEVTVPSGMIRLETRTGD